MVSLKLDILRSNISLEDLDSLTVRSVTTKYFLLLQGIQNMRTVRGFIAIVQHYDAPLHPRAWRVLWIPSASNKE